MDFGTVEFEKGELATWVTGAVGLLGDGPGNRMGVSPPARRRAAGGRPPYPFDARPTGRWWPPRAPLTAPTGTEQTSLARALLALDQRHRRPGIRVVVSDFVEPDGTVERPFAWEQGAAAAQRPARRRGGRGPGPARAGPARRRPGGPQRPRDRPPPRDLDLAARTARGSTPPWPPVTARAVAEAVRAAGAGHVVLRTDRDWVGDLARFVRAARAPAPYPADGARDEGSSPPGGSCCSSRWPCWRWPTCSSNGAAAATPSRSPRCRCSSASTPRRPGWRRHFPAALPAARVPRPRPGRRPGPRPTSACRVKNATVMVAIDVSISMRATDVEPNGSRPLLLPPAASSTACPTGFNIGLVTSGSAAVRAAPTTDREQVEGGAGEPDPVQPHGHRGGRCHLPGRGRGDSAPSGRGGASKATVVLLSDGTNTTGRTPQEAAAAARAAGVPVSTIAYGTPQGTVELDGQLIPVPVDEETLSTLAQRHRRPGLHRPDPRTSSTTSTTRTSGPRSGCGPRPREITPVPRRAGPAARRGGCRPLAPLVLAAALGTTPGERDPRADRRPGRASLRWW